MLSWGRSAVFAALLALSPAAPALAQTLVESDGIVYRVGPYSVGGALRDIDRQAAAAQGLLDPQLQGLLDQSDPRRAELLDLGSAEGLRLRGGTAARPSRAPGEEGSRPPGARARGDELDVGLYAEMLFDHWRLAATLRYGLVPSAADPQRGGAALSYGFTPLEGLQVRLGPTFSWANSAYAAQPPGFGSWTGSRLFHLGQDEGWRDVGFSVSATWDLVGNWALDSTLGVARPLSEPGAEAQDEAHGFGLLGIRYRF